MSRKIYNRVGLPKELWMKLADTAKQDTRSRNSLIEKVLTEYVLNKEQEPLEVDHAHR